MEKAGVHEWDPFSEMQSIWEEMAAMQRRMESVLASHQMFPGPGVEGLSFSPRGGFFDPDVEIQETKGAYTVKVDLPGMEKDKIDVQVTDNVLRISGERDRTEESRNEDEGNYFYRSERTFGSFSRQIPLPENVDTLKAKAEYKNGVLLVTLPKLQPSGQEKQATKVPVI
ncbi:MAG: Hsp20/alpha crystallin family protein [Candidatus Omnitrophica bacterium]|nr:Hsp20/alpha crystallin family protein [Candidatus Omnitrophota bacterium]